MAIDDKIRIEQILTACEEIAQFISKRIRPDLESDRMLIMSLLKELEIVGEAANRISQETKNELGNIPWDKIKAMRNILVHDYFSIDYEVVWLTVKEDIPDLYLRLKSYMK